MFAVERLFRFVFLRDLVAAGSQVHYIVRNKSTNHQSAQIQLYLARMAAVFIVFIFFMCILGSAVVAQ